MVSYVLIAFVADRLRRRPLILVWFLGSAIMTPITFFVPGSLGLLYFLAAINGVFTPGQFGWVPVYLPELFPTMARGTASSFFLSTTGGAPGAHDEDVYGGLLGLSPEEIGRLSGKG